MCDIVVKTLTFAISSPDEFLLVFCFVLDFFLCQIAYIIHVAYCVFVFTRCIEALMSVIFLLIKSYYVYTWHFKS